MAIPILISNRKGLIIIDNGKRYIIKGPLFTLRKYRKLRNTSLVIGYVGARGAGKSVNAARDVAINYLMLGKKVWSNMDIAFHLLMPGGNLRLMQTNRYSKLKMQDLDEIYSDGCIYVDEINMELAEARRAMAEENLTTNYIVQQLRKRRLNLIWSAQSEMHVDSRLRWQTDIFIKCVDKSKPKGPGEITLLACYDYSGIFHGRSPGTQREAFIESKIIRNKPWWNIYDTWQLQGIDNEEKEERVNLKLKEAQEIAEEIVAYMTMSGKVRFLKSEIWQQWGIYGDPAMMGMVGKALRDLGIEPSYPHCPYYKFDKDLIIGVA